MSACRKASRSTRARSTRRLFQAQLRRRQQAGPVAAALLASPRRATYAPALAAAQLLALPLRRERGFASLAVLAAGLRCLASATLCLSASIRSITGASATGSGSAICWPGELRLEHLRGVPGGTRCVNCSPARTRRRGSRSPGARDRARPSWRLGLRHRLVDLGLRVDVLGDEQRLERERVALRAGSGRASPCPQSTNRPIAPIPVVLEHASAAARRGGAGRGSRRHEEVRAVEVDGVDLLERHEALDVDRARTCSARSIASRSASSTITNSPFATSQPLTISSGPTSRSCTGHQRFCS